MAMRETKRRLKEAFAFDEHFNQMDSFEIRNNEAYVCENCGEAYFTPEISRKIDEVMRDFHGHKLLAYPIAAGEVEIKV